jgi:cytidyltransferase-like protein|tara:strand:- start:542 stop:1309 length:768 start_codon:yes stop_codon:yes gene_type:complete
MKVVLVTGGFDPLHSGHLQYFKEAKKLGDVLHVGLNSDEWLSRKKGRPFMPFSERVTILEALEVVDKVISFDDTDDSACGAIYKTMATNANVEIVFANGGDRNNENTPEYKIYGGMNGISFAYGIGGSNKKNSSSWILDEWKTQKTDREWGYWRVLDDKPNAGYKVKELVIYPGKSLSDQRHFKRSEVWNILQGTVTMETDYNNMKDSIQLKPHTTHYEIGKEVWHKASNNGDIDAHVLEVQWGECVEEDIERRD